MGLDRICHKIHPTARVEIRDETVGEFVTNYLAENGRRIAIIGKISVNVSFQFFGLSYQDWGSGFPYITNLLDQVEATGWGISKNPNQIWGGFKNANRIINSAWGASIDASSNNSPQSPGRPHAARCRIHNNFLHIRHQERLWRQFNHSNPLVH